MFGRRLQNNKYHAKGCKGTHGVRWSASAARKAAARRATKRFPQSKCSNSFWLTSNRALERRCRVVFLWFCDAKKVPLKVKRSSYASRHRALGHYPRPCSKKEGHRLDHNSPTETTSPTKSSQNKSPKANKQARTLKQVTPSNQTSKQANKQTNMNSQG